MTTKQWTVGDMVEVCVKGDVIPQSKAPYLQRNLEVFFAELRAESARLTSQLQAVSDQLTEARALAWLWDEMGERRIGTLSFDYGMGMIAAFSFDGDSVEAVTMQGIFAEIEAMGDAWA